MLYTMLIILECLINLILAIINATLTNLLQGFKHSRSSVFPCSNKVTQVYKARRGRPGIKT